MKIQCGVRTDDGGNVIEDVVRFGGERHGVPVYRAPNPTSRPGDRAADSSWLGLRSRSRSSWLELVFVFNDQCVLTACAAALDADLARVATPLEMTFSAERFRLVDSRTALPLPQPLGANLLAVC